jgi:hypothetical protein
MSDENYFCCQLWQMTNEKAVSLDRNLAFEDGADDCSAKKDFSRFAGFLCRLEATT